MQANGRGRFFISSSDAQKLADFRRVAARAGILGKEQPGAVLCFGISAAREKAAELLTALTFGPWEQRWLSALCERRYEYFNAGERRLLLQKAALLTREDDFSWGLFAGPLRKERLQKALTEHLVACPQLHVEGFLRFRLPGYREYLQTLLSIAADEVLTEQEDKEYLLLLRGFMAARPSGGEIHVFLLRQGCYDICAYGSGGLRFLEGGRLQGCEDMLIYALISLSPQRLFLHLEQPLPPALGNLLQDLFGSRLKLELSGGASYQY